MKTYNSTTGGHPLTNDDFTWLQSQFLEVTQEMLSLLSSPGGGNRLLAGGDIETVTPTHRNVDGGWLVWNNELVKFNGASLMGAGYVVVAKSTNNIPPSKVYANAAVVWPYQEVSGQLQLTASLGNPLYFYLETAIRFGVSPWINATLVATDWQAFQPAPNLYHQPAYRLDAMGRVELRGQIQVGTTGGVTTAFVLPAKYWPKRSVGFAASYNNNAGAFLSCWVEVAANGEVVISGVPATPGFHLSLCGISWDARS